MAARAAAVLSTAGVTVAIARLLGPSLSGDYAVMTALLLAATALSSVGIDFGVVWMVSRRRWSAASAFLTTQLAAFALGGMGALAGAAAYLAGADGPFRGIDAGVAVLTLAAVPLSLASLCAAQVVLARDAYRRSAAIRSAFAGLALLFVPPLAAAFELEGAMAGVLAAASGGWAIALALRPRESPPRRRLETGALLAAGRFGLKPYLANALGLVIYRLDVFILSGVAGSSEVGFYAAAVAATSLLTLAPMGLSTALFPRLAALGNSPSRRDRVEARAIRHTVLVLAPTALLLAGGIALLLEPVFGTRFAPAVEPALILIPGAAALGLASTVYASLAGRGRPGYTLRAGLLVAPLSVALYVVLIPPLGATGAAIASTVSYVSSAALGAFYLRRLTTCTTRGLLVPSAAELHDYRVGLRRIRVLTSRGER